MSSDATVAEVRLLDALFANATLGMGWWDEQLRFKRVNQVLADINGLPVDEHVGRRISEVLPGAVGAQVQAQLQAVMSSGEALYDVEVGGETPAAFGQQRRWIAHYFPVVGPDGRPEGVSAAVVEVTTQRAAATLARDERRKSQLVAAEVRAIYAALPLGVAFLSPDLRFVRVNQALATMNGRAIGEHLGRSLGDVLGPHAQTAEKLMRQVLEAQESVDFSVEVPDADHDGETRSFEGTYFPVFLPGGDLLGVGTVVREITDRRREEREKAGLLQEALASRAQSQAMQARAELASAEARQAGEAAEAARSELEAAARRATFLAEAGRRLASSLDYDETLAAVARSAVPEIADWCALSLVEANGRIRVAALAHQDPAREKLAWELLERYPVAPDAPHGTPNVVRTGEPEIAADVPQELLANAAQDADHLQLLQSLQLHHYVITPIKGPEGVLGALSFVLGESGRRFAGEDIELAQALASRAALHVTNARLYAEREHVAATLQASLRPRALPAIAGLDLGAGFRLPGGETSVGGDFYDVFHSGSGVPTVIIGDVSGKGPEAASLTTLARYTLRTAAMLSSDPGHNLGLLNRALNEEAGNDRFCTVAYANVYPDGNGAALRVSSAGHPPALRVGVDGSVEALEGGRGPIAGAILAAEFAEARFHLAPGEAVVFYTDGVTEVRTGDVTLGDRELVKTLRRMAGSPAQAMADAVLEHALALQAGKPRDDLAVLVVKTQAALPDQLDRSGA